MLPRLGRHPPWLIAWGALALLGATLLAQWNLGRMHERFDADVQLAWRLLGQRATQNETVLSTLALARSVEPDEAARANQPRLPGAYPQVLAVYRRSGEAVWPEPGLQAAEAESRRAQTPALANLQLPRGRYQLVLAGESVSFALLIDLRAMVPWNEWPMAPEASPVRITLAHAEQSAVLQAGPVREGGGSGWQFAFRRPLATQSQPFEFVAEQHVGWSELPWGAMSAWTLLVAILLLATRAVLRMRTDRLRAHELLRLGQANRANTLGELAAGMTHELQNPLSDILTHARAAQRMIDADPPDVATTREVLEQMVQQARRASNILGQLHHAVERPDLGAQTQDLDMQAFARKALHLLEAELRDRSIRTGMRLRGPAFQVRAQPAALEQILHALLMNAIQALEQVPAPERQLQLEFEAGAGVGQLRVQDSGPGMSNDALQHAFQPFFSTRDGALGLGLSQSESLAAGMGGSLLAFNRQTRGAEFCLSLPLAALR